jgi:hypothetical protein
VVLLGDEAQVDAHFGLFEDSANLDARELHGLRRMYHRLRNHFWTHPTVLLGYEAEVDARWMSKVTLVMWNVISVHLGIVLVSVQDRCTVCAKRSIGLEIVLDPPDGTPRRRGSSGCSFRSGCR